MRTTLQHLFTPHHTNNYRARILQPAGLTVIVALFVLSQSLVRLTELSGLLPTGYILGYASNITAQQTIEQTNSQRASQGLPPLQANAQLTQAAIAKANHMFANNYWAHVAPDGTTPWVFIKNSGYGYAVAGENLARDFDTTGSMLSAWMASPTHKDNIMHQKYAEIGVGVVNGTLEGVETTLVVQMFGQPSRAAAQTSPTAVKTEVAAVPAEQTAATQPTKIPTLAPTTAIAASPTALPSPTEAPTALAATNPPPDAFDNQFLGTRYSPASTNSLSAILVSPLWISKAVSGSIVFLLVSVLLYDLFFIHHAKIPRRVGKNWAHLTILVVGTMLVLLTTSGKVL
jgi:hypothetical protein